MLLIPDFEIGIWNAWIFMIWLIVIPVSSTFIIKKKKLLKKLSASVPMRFEKISNILSMVVLIVGFIYSIFLPLKLNTTWFYIGLLIFLFAFFFILTVLYTLRDAKLDRPFTNGSYRYSRHPFYFGTFLIYICVSIMSLSWIFLVITSIHVIHLLIVVPAEERYCLKTYGKEYQDYMERTPRYIGLPKSKK